MKFSEVFKKNNAKRISIFILISFLFLIFSKLSTTYRHTILLNFTFQNLEDEVVITDNEKEVNAVVETSGFSFLPYIFNKTETIKLDAKSHIKVSNNHLIFPVKEHKYLFEDAFGKSFKILKLNADTLRFGYDLKHSKYVPVKLNTNLSLAKGYDIKDDIKISTDSVKIIGAKKTLDTIKFVKTELLTISDLKTNINEEVLIAPLSNIGIIPDRTTISAEITKFTEGSLKVPLEIINTPSNLKINFFPKNVTIKYYVDLENYKNIKSKDFKIVCDFGAISKRTTYLIPKIVRKPKSVKSCNLVEKRINYLIL